MEAPLAQHQGGDGHRFAPGLKREDVELLPRAEALPPRAYPFVADKGVVDAGLVDQPAPERLQVEEPLVVHHRFDRACRNRAPIESGCRGRRRFHRTVSGWGTHAPTLLGWTGIDPIRSHEKDSFARWRPGGAGLEAARGGGRRRANGPAL